MPRLYVLSGPDLGSDLAFEGAVVLGRERSCDLVLHAPSVSRRHARIEPRGERWFVVDLGSSNGTHVDGERVREAELAEGEIFRLGDLELRFRAGGAASASTHAPPASTADDEHPDHASEPPRTPPPALDDTGEVVLEGDWEDVGTSSVAEGPPRAGAWTRADAEPRPAHAARPPSTRAPDAPSTRRSDAPSATPSDARSAKPRDPSLAETVRAAAYRSAATAAPGRATGSAGRVLQYHRHERRSGVLLTDFAQQPAWLRWSAYTLLAALALGLAWASFELTRTLRARGESAVIEAGE